MTTTNICPFSRLPLELHLEIIDYLPFEASTYLRMTCRYFNDIIPKPMHEELLVIETSDWAIEEGLFACCHCLRLRRPFKFADKMTSGKRDRGRKAAALRFCIECGLTVPWREPGARGYNRASMISVLGKKWQVCKNCGLFERFPEWRRDMAPYVFCPNGYEANRKMVDKASDLAKWIVNYQEAAEKAACDSVRELKRGPSDRWFYSYKAHRGLEIRVHGLPTSSL
jgi:hypothetical protein